MAVKAKNDVKLIWKKLTYDQLCAFKIKMSSVYQFENDSGNRLTQNHRGSLYYKNVWLKNFITKPAFRSEPLARMTLKVLNSFFQLPNQLRIPRGSEQSPL